MSNEQRNTIWRFAIIFIIILIGFIAVIGRIVYIQTVERDKWLQAAEYQEPTHKVIPAIRGNILDCKGQLLASSMPRYDVFMDTKAQALVKDSGKLFYQYVDTLAHDLSVIFKSHSKAEYKQRLIQEFKKGNTRYKLHNGPINYIQRKQLDQNPLVKKGKFKSGVYYEDRHERINPYGNLAKRTIGDIYANSGEGNVGLEKRFEKELRGEDGIGRVERIGGREEMITIQEAQDGMDVVTTLDMNLQDIVDKALKEKVKERNAQWGCCILMETQTGYIRAISNVDRTGEDSFKERLNHAVLRVDPGSTFKTVSLAAMMNDGLVTLDDTVSTTEKPWWYPDNKNRKGARHTDSHPKDTIYTVRSALAVSSNIAFAKLVTDRYDHSATKFVKSIQKLGIRDSVYCEIPGAQTPRINPPVNDTVTVSKMAYGYAVEVTPMTLVMFYNAIANNGKMMRPMLVTAIRKDGKDVRSFKPEVVKSSICSKKVIADLKLALHDVVWDNKLGTASINKWKQPKAQSQLVSIAGKTGTAQIRNPKATKRSKSDYDGLHHRITFVGYFPEENPQYTCICMIEDPQPPRTYDAGMDCGSTVRKIAEKTMAYTGCYVYEEGEQRLEKR